MKKILALIDMLLSNSLFYKLVKFRLKYRNIKIGPTVKFIEKGGRFSYAINNRIGDFSVLIQTAESLISLEKDVWLGDNVYLEPIRGTGIVLQQGCSIQDRCRLIGDIDIGQNTLLAPNVYMSSGNHFFNLVPSLPIRFQDELAAKDISLTGLRNKPIKIGDDCWIGTNVVVMQGVQIGKGCIIGANTVVTKDIPPYSVAVGTPAKVVKKRLDFLPPGIIVAVNKDHQPYFYEGCMPHKYNDAEKSDFDIKVSLSQVFSVFLSTQNRKEDMVYLIIDRNTSSNNLYISYENVPVKVNNGRQVIEWALKINSEYITKFEFQFIGNGFNESPIYIIEAGIK